MWVGRAMGRKGRGGSGGINQLYINLYINLYISLYINLYINHKVNYICNILLTCDDGESQKETISALLMSLTACIFLLYYKYN